MAILHPRNDLLVKQVSTGKPGDKAYKNRQGDRRGWRGKGDTSNENNSFKAFPKDGNEGKYKHCILLTPPLECASVTIHSDGVFLQGLRQLDAPFLLHLRDTKESSSENTNHKGGKDGKGSLPVILCLGPSILADAIEGANEAGSNDHTDEQSQSSAIPDL
jgi:hypothetical protein